MTDENQWPWQGQVYEVPVERDSQLALIKNVPGIMDEEKYLIQGMIALSVSNEYRRTDQSSLKSYLEKNNRPASDTKIKTMVLTLHELGVFDRYEVPRAKYRPAVVFRLNDIGVLTFCEKLLQRDKELANPKLEREVSSIIPEKLGNILTGNDDRQHSYTRKANHIILRRCSSDPDFLGKKVPIPLEGMSETVQVVQRTASGIPPMDGSEDRIQQAILTMFKEDLMEFARKNPDVPVEEYKNMWTIDMRKCCRAMNLKPSSANIANHAPCLFQLRYNTFEIHFDPNGKAAQAFNLNDPDHRQHVQDAETQVIHQLSRDRIDQFFFSFLEPLRDDIVYSPDQKSLLPTPDVQEIPIEQRSTDDELIRDAKGRLYRFYRVSFHPIIFKECLDDALGQMHKQPPSMLEEGNVIARLLTYLAQRIFTKSRTTPFEATWGDIVQEIRPLDSQKSVFARIETVFKRELEKQDLQWDPHTSPTINLHGYNFRVIVPKGKKRKKESWRMLMWRDRNHPYTGDEGPAAKARIAEARRAIEGEVLT